MRSRKKSTDDTNDYSRLYVADENEQKLLFPKQSHSHELLLLTSSTVASCRYGISIDMVDRKATITQNVTAYVVTVYWYLTATTGVYAVSLLAGTLHDDINWHYVRRRPWDSSSVTLPLDPNAYNSFMVGFDCYDLTMLVFGVMMAIQMIHPTQLRCVTEALFSTFLGHDWKMVILTYNCEGNKIHFKKSAYFSSISSRLTSPALTQTNWKIQVNTSRVNTVNWSFKGGQCHWNLARLYV